VGVVFQYFSWPNRRLRVSGVFAALTACFFSYSVEAQTSPCALTGDTTVSSADITAAINMALGTQTCTSTLEASPPLCTVITVQRVVNASLGQPCVVYNAHAATLTWTASTTPSVTYNVYRATTSTGPFTTPLNSSAITGVTYKDTTVAAGQTYYYAVAAVAAGGAQSANTSPVQAIIPTP
jgi:hypothetical protein